jgi:DNA-binding transcriptional regulator PaaX
MSTNQSYSKKILKILGEQRVFTDAELRQRAQNGLESADSGQKYAVNRSLKNLTESGLIERLESDQQGYVRLTDAGKQKLRSLQLDPEGALVSTEWDGFWRIVMLDIPEDRKSEREALRYLLKKAGFIAIKNSVWVSPHPLEHLFTGIKADLGLSTELMVFVTDKVDADTEKELMKVFKK